MCAPATTPSPLLSTAWTLLRQSSTLILSSEYRQQSRPFSYPACAPGSRLRAQMPCADFFAGPNRKVSTGAAAHRPCATIASPSSSRRHPPASGIGTGINRSPFSISSEYGAWRTPEISVRLHPCPAVSSSGSHHEPGRGRHRCFGSLPVRPGG